MAMYKIMIVEDDKSIREELGTFLSRNGYESQMIDDFDDVVTKIINAQPHLVLLDLNLPVYDGYFICREIRKVSDMPIMIVTSRASEIDELMSMNLGADDFVSKPYNLQILLARMERLLSRSYEGSDKTVWMVNDVVLNLNRNMIIYKGQQVELTKNEFRILYCLFKHKNEIVSRDELMDDMWATDLFVDDNALTVNINRIRKKLTSIGLRDFIQTKRGLGYMVYEN